MINLIAPVAALIASRVGIPAGGLTATLFVDPIAVSGWRKMLLIIPLSLAISVVYKTTRLKNLRDLPLATLALTVTIVVGMYAVGFGLWVLYHALA